MGQHGAARGLLAGALIVSAAIVAAVVSGASTIAPQRVETSHGTCMLDNVGNLEEIEEKWK